jgi:hypothetical protein
MTPMNADANQQPAIPVAEAVTVPLGGAIVLRGINHAIAD